MKVLITAVVSLLIFSRVVSQSSNHATATRQTRDGYGHCINQHVVFLIDPAALFIYISDTVNCRNYHAELQFDNTTISNETTVNKPHEIAVYRSLQMKNVTVLVNNTCDICLPEKYCLQDISNTEYKLYPRGYKGNVIEDLSNKYSNCKFDIGSVIQFEICVHLGKSTKTECFRHNICSNSLVRLSSCSDNSSMTLENGNMKVGLEILDKIENGTVISVYCETGTDDCQATMLFNTGILLCDECSGTDECTEGQCICEESSTGQGISCRVICEDCDENAQCINGMCMCNENFTGNGTFCEEIQPTPPSPGSSQSGLHGGTVAGIMSGLLAAIAVYS